MFGTPLSIKIVAKDEAMSIPSEATELILTDATIIENATASSRTGVVLQLKGPDGKIYWVPTTARLIANGLASAIKGAAERFGDDLNQA